MGLGEKYYKTEYYTLIYCLRVGEEYCNLKPNKRLVHLYVYVDINNVFRCDCLG